ncbi:MAG: bifunctional 4-hydroxy-2-oxoglutarate aldolase/2-dehydro-3-deoxy-phosphogluconate aldolase [Bryobacterales bacterium]|nr:bifunctional 4-hydroxy-2-oxoglutarate aldolase/2-dehydro-3-deoxy-phosphogluconate aldolase [Bryobacterales bacterium]
MTRKEVGAKIREVGLIPAVRVSTAEDAWFAAEAVSKGGIPIVELTMTVPGATELIDHLVKKYPTLLVGAGTVLDKETARDCLDAGAKFLTSPGLDLETVEFAVQQNVVVMPGVLTPSEVMGAVKAGADFVKIFPCAQVGGPAYIHALRAPFPGVSFIASGGVNQQTARDYIHVGAAALGVGSDLIPPRAIAAREHEWIVELARRFVHLVKNARSEVAVNP